MLEPSVRVGTFTTPVGFVQVTKEDDTMNYTNDIFRKRPILGNRILVPIRDKPKWKHIMSLWEAKRRCKKYTETEQSFYDSSTGCNSMERNAGGTKFWEWGCNCELDDDTPKEDLIILLKRFATNWK